MSALARHMTCREARQHVDVGGTNIIHVAIHALAVINWEELVLGFVKASELLAVQDERNRGPGMRWTAYGMLPA